MNLKNKLKGLPTIYYINLDNRTDRRDYMESQFDYWEIKDFKRISGTKYLASEFDSWKHFIIDINKIYMKPRVLANLMTHLEMINNWLENTNDEYMIMMEDDYDLNLIKYWDFDWDYLMNNIPYDWDCIQFSFETFKYLHFFLHPKLRHTFHGACMINRHYAKKLVNLHMINGEFKFNNNVSDLLFRLEGKSFGECCTTDYIITHCGKTYCIPLICINTESPSCENYEKINYPTQQKVREVMYDWWQNEKKYFTKKDFFIYGKPYDYKMTKTLNFKEHPIIGIF